MIRIKSSIRISNDTFNYFSGFEAELRGLIKRKVNEKDFANLRLTFELYVEDCKDYNKVYVLESNANPDIKNSLKLCSEIDSYIHSKEVKFKSYLPTKTILRVVLTFAQTQQEAQAASVSAFIAVEGKYDFNQIIIPKEKLDEIYSAINLIELQDLVFNKWNFKSIDPVPRCILNFYGKPGTGKTMCAHAIARKIGKKILALNYAEIESKYVGDSAKNLMSAFSYAKENDCVLFFDEADSFLGKRIQNVSQGADQALNSLRSQMLILLEEFHGIVIFATNLVKNFDVAFESRILKQIQFELPDESSRCKIISKMIPDELPLEHKLTDEELLTLSQTIGLISPREIKNAVLECIINKATQYRENAVFNYDDFLQAFKSKREAVDNLEKEKGNLNVNGKKLEDIIKEKINSSKKASMETLSETSNEYSSEASEENLNESSKDVSNENQ